MIPKHTKLPPSTYKRIHSTLRARLHKEAFDAYFACKHCGAHQNLQIHIPNCDPKLAHLPGFFDILCPKCHKRIRT